MLADGPAELPDFRFHPDPVATGAVVEKPGVTCPCCGLDRGWAYVGPLYSALPDIPDDICPWCIADGSASKKFAWGKKDFPAVFVAGLGEYLRGDDGRINNFHNSALAKIDITQDAKDELYLRTPGVSSFQDIYWPVCCAEPTTYLGPREGEELLEMTGPLDSLIATGTSEQKAKDLLASAEVDGSVLAHTFRCEQCGTHLVEIDTD